MQYGSIGGISKKVSRLVQGTMPIASEEDSFSFDLLDRVFEMGCTTFDTAHIYENGSVERTFGRWLQQQGLRDEVVIIGKGCHHSADRNRVTPFDLESDLHDSLVRLQTDYIDLYLLHRDDPDVPVEPLVDKLHELKTRGLIHAYGGSNWHHDRIQQANSYASQTNKSPFVASSPHYSLAVQYEEPWDGCVSLTGEKNRDALTWYKQQQLAVFAWSSLAGGFFSGRFTRMNLEEKTSYFDALVVRCYTGEDNFKRYDRALELAKQKGVSVPQIALAFVMHQKMNMYALVGCGTPAEFQANVDALEIQLTSDECMWLDTGILSEQM
jgi:aryl-alcohol dehydrogenase-like predicted oxidoreductase